MSVLPFLYTTWKNQNNYFYITSQLNNFCLAILKSLLQMSNGVRSLQCLQLLIWRAKDSDSRLLPVLYPQATLWWSKIPGWTPPKLHYYLNTDSINIITFYENCVLTKYFSANWFRPTRRRVVIIPSGLYYLQTINLDSYAHPWISRQNKIHDEVFPPNKTSSRMLYLKWI